MWGLSLCRQKPEDPSPHTHTHREQPPAPSPDGIPAQRTYVSGRRFGLTSERDPSAIGRKFSGSTTGPEAGLRRGEQPLQMPAYTVGGSGPEDAAGGAQSTPGRKDGWAAPATRQAGPALREEQEPCDASHPPLVLRALPAPTSGLTCHWSKQPLIRASYGGGLTGQFPGARGASVLRATQHHSSGARLGRLGLGTSRDGRGPQDRGGARQSPKA